VGAIIKDVDLIASLDGRDATLWVHNKFFLTVINAFILSIKNAFILSIKNA